MTRPHLLQLPALLACCLALAWPLSSLAQGSDRQQPMNVEADALRYEEARQTSIFTGNVVITKGSIVIRADRVEVRQDPQGNQFGLATGSAGQRAFFRQQRQGVDEFVEGEAERIEYDSRADTMRLTGQATLRRLRGAQVSDETMGRLIVYNNTTDVFTVDGGAATASNPGGRVRAMITPTPRSDAAPPASPGTPLRPSNNLGGAPR